MIAQITYLKLLNPKPGICSFIIIDLISFGAEISAIESYVAFFIATLDHPSEVIKADRSNISSFVAGFGLLKPTFDVMAPGFETGRHPLLLRCLCSLLLEAKYVSQFKQVASLVEKLGIAAQKVSTLLASA